ncbi:MAG: Gfo/Idh/MocA family protein [Acidobacteriota bacterium]
MDRNRRDFLKSAGFAAAPLFVPRSAWGANDKPAYGIIGTGGRGRFVSRSFQKQGAECVAVCDVYEPHLEAARKDAPDAKPYVDYHDLLAQKGIDFVLVATPDHQHCPNLLASLDAGKDVYLEKPMSHSIAESKKMIAAVRKTKQIVQVGMQRRSSAMVRRAKALVDQGVLGRIALVKPMWNWNISGPLDNSPLPGKLDWKRFLGPAQQRDLEPMRFRAWRLFWDYSGGNMTDQGTHLMDVTQWLTGTSESLATSAVCHGQIVKYVGSEVPDVFCAAFEYPKHMVTWTLDYCSTYQDGWSITYQGDQGTLVMDEEGFRIYNEPWAKRENREPAFYERGGIPVDSHVANFLDCIKTRQEPNCPVEVGASGVSAPHLANLAFKQGRKVRMSEAA